MQNNVRTCPLCLNQDSVRRPIQGHRFFACSNCELLYRDPDTFLPIEEERLRYESHENHESNPGYITFLSPLVEVVHRLVPKNATGLDFGSGPDPVLSRLLERIGYKMNQFDPYFATNANTLETTYDFIVVSEAAEHFKEVRREFQRLSALLKKRGVIAFSTSLNSAQIDLGRWAYPRDPTHVAIYSETTFRWISENHHFLFSETDGKRIVVLTKK